jgi:hypothetical protein
MSDRAFYALSVAIVTAAAILAFAPGKDAAVGASSTTGTACAPRGAPVIHSAVHEKSGFTTIVLAFPDGRYIRWESSGTGDFIKKEQGFFATQESK